MPAIPSPRPPSERRKRRLARELVALQAMRGHFRTREIVWAVLSIPLLALLCLIVALKLHWLSESPALAIGGALAAGVAIWWVGRRWFALAALIVIGLLVIAFEDIPDLGSFSSDDKPDRKAARREKLERAIARREALLQGSGRPSP
ncbi:MAG: hypothetical protein HXX10_11855 [Rhodoplanes sp.]|uniref:hypothetical protein n=1 Tax=Rhodoplanes sp. TaxID=1968906 RepID=UPI00181BDC6C|nr:hypothetical protein [Rhodoplanes sp.]NVO14722.1 hypothetical protein [Rhodoplanes sp.]